MSQLIKPSEIESTARDIIEYYDKSEAPHADKIRVLTMLREYYESVNDTVIDQWFAQLLQRVITRHENTQTGFEA